MHDGLSPPARSAEAPVHEPVPPLRSAAITALRQRFAALRPDLELSPSGYVPSLEDNLLPGVEPRHFVEDLKKGAGRELEWKVRAVHSSTALAVNTFAWFRDEPGDLPPAGVTNFETVAFPVPDRAARRSARPSGSAGARPRERRSGRIQVHRTPRAQGPLLLARLCRADRRRKVGRSLVFGDGESPRAPGQLRVARRRAVDQARLRPRALLQRTADDAALPVLGAAGPPRHPICRQHRAEIERFSRMVAGGFPAFRAQSYPDLWDAWVETAGPGWLRGHVANLRARYAISLGDGRLG